MTWAIRPADIIVPENADPESARECRKVDREFWADF
jgi:hypothetical protein